MLGTMFMSNAQTVSPQASRSSAVLIYPEGVGQWNSTYELTHSILDSGAASSPPILPKLDLQPTGIRATPVYQNALLEVISGDAGLSNTTNQKFCPKSHTEFCAPQAFCQEINVHKPDGPSHHAIQCAALPARRAASSSPSGPKLHSSQSTGIRATRLTRMPWQIQVHAMYHQAPGMQPQFCSSKFHTEFFAPQAFCPAMNGPKPEGPSFLPASQNAVASTNNFANAAFEVSH